MITSLPTDAQPYLYAFKAAFVPASAHGRSFPSDESLYRAWKIAEAVYDGRVGLGEWTRSVLGTHR